MDSRTVVEVEVLKWPIPIHSGGGCTVEEAEDWKLWAHMVKCM